MARHEGGEGTPATVQRLRHLVDRLHRETLTVFEGASFEPRWLPLVRLLEAEGPRTITSLAQRLGITHPAVHQVATALAAAGYVATYKDSGDRRKRVLALTREGREVLSQLAPQLARHDDALAQLFGEAAPHLATELAAVEEALDRVSLADRVARAPLALTVTTWRPDLADAFRDLNLEWIEHYFAVEEADRKVLDNPQAAIIDRGGDILFAESGNTVVGTCALVPAGGQTVELAKMAVRADLRGSGIGMRLGQAVLERAAALGFQDVFLESNSILGPALTVYERLGFEHAERPEASEYARADIFMRRSLADIV